MAFLGDWQITETLTLYIQTVNPDTGAAWAADTFPTYRIYHLPTGTPIATGTYGTLAGAGATGTYAARVPLTIAAGFEAGATYGVRTAVTIVGALEAFQDSFTIPSNPRTIVPARLRWRAAAARPGNVVTIMPARRAWAAQPVDLSTTVTLIATGTGGNWTTAATWTPAVTPTAAHNCLLNATSGPVTIDAGAVCRSLNVTGYTSTLTHTAGVTLTIGDATAGLGNVALEFPTSGWTYTLGSSATSEITFVSTSATQQTVNFGGKTTADVTFNSPANGSWKYTGAHVIINTAAPWTLTKGSVDLNGQTLTVRGLVCSAANVRSLTLGAANIHCLGWNMGTGVNLTLNATGSTITLETGANTFTGGGQTYGTLVLPASATALTIVGSNTFTTLTVTAPRTLHFTAATTTTFLNPPTLVGSAGNLITIDSATAATHTLTLASGSVTADWLNLTNSIATGGALWNAGAHSIDNGGNTGWIFATAVLIPARLVWQAQARGAPTFPGARLVWTPGRILIMQEFPFREYTAALTFLPD